MGRRVRLPNGGTVAAESARLTRWMATAAAVAALAACVTEPAPQRMNFGELALADRVRIADREAGSRADIRDVNDPSTVAAFYQVVATRPDGWHRPWTESPNPRYTVTFSRSGKDLGSYGVGSSYLVADGYVRNLAGADLRAVLSLVQAAGPLP